MIVRLNKLKCIRCEAYQYSLEELAEACRTIYVEEVNQTK